MATFTPIVHTRCVDLELASSRGHCLRLRHAVAHHQGAPGVVTMFDVPGDVLVHLGFRRCHEHPSGAFAHQLIKVKLERILFGLFRSHYAQHAAY